MGLTEAAAERLSHLYQTGEQGRLLRVSVNSKGCNGKSYEMSWVGEAGPGDEVIADKGVTVLVDRKATLYLIGTVMDYRDGLMETGFTFSNPNEKSRCGCGESFNV
jgi:iron-sulfur cluster assembly protein